MTHIAPMADSDGDFGEFIPTTDTCGKCKAFDIRCRSWESHCGGYEDYQYRCFSCGNTWWVEGPDA